MGVMITERKWVHFKTQPESAIISLVREFFANVSAEGALVVQVRGQALVYDRKTINAFFQMPNYDKDYLVNDI